MAGWAQSLLQTAERLAELPASGHRHSWDLAGSRITDVARKAGISKQAVGQLVDELQGLGYVTRVSDPTDARARLVVLTDQGRTAMFAGLAALARVEARVRHDLGDVDHFRSQLETVIRLLDRPS